MSFALWLSIVGALLVSIALVGSYFRRLPLTTTMCYFVVGLLLGPVGFGWLSIDPVKHAGVLVHLAEIAVVVSLFNAGLKLRVPWRDPLWRVTLRLALGSMLLTVGFIALALHFFLGASWGAAVLVGAMLAPTDPVLASEVQVRHAGDDDRLRFGLTAEAGLNDGTAFPLFVLGLGMLGLHDLGAGAWRWWTIDVVWAIGAGLAIGTVIGRGASELVLHLRQRHQEAVGHDEFLALGLIGLTYGVATLLSASGFLAVFAAGLALRSVERSHTGGEKSPADVLAQQRKSDDEPRAEVHPEKAPAKLMQSILGFNEQVERLIEVALVFCLGAMLVPREFPASAWWFIPLLFLVIRPAAVQLGLLGSSATGRERWLFSWLGIRGIGSIFYLLHGVQSGLSEQFTRPLVSLVILTIAVSIFVHGASAAPLLRFGRPK